MGLAGRDYQLPTGAACAPGHEGDARADDVGLLSATPRASGLVLLLACAAASERATPQPLAFAIQHPANCLTARGAAAASLVTARLHKRLMTPRPMAHGSRRNNFCCVTTRRRILRDLRRLWRRCGALTARTFCLGMLGFDRLVLAPIGLPLRCLPAPEQAHAFGILAITLIPTARLVLASTAFAQADALPRSSATAVWLIMTMAHGSAFSQGTARGERANVLLGRLSKPRSQSIPPCMNQTGKKTACERRRQGNEKPTTTWSSRVQTPMREPDREGNGLRIASPRRRETGSQASLPYYPVA